MTNMEQKVLQESLWNTNPDQLIQVDWNSFSELRVQTVLTLTAPILSRLSMQPELCASWKNEILQQISYNVNYKYVQSHLPITAPYVILKGTSASKYYPYPEYRTMGDIDIMPRRQDFEFVYHELLDGGFQVVSESDREVAFKYNGIIIELHRYFASLNDPKQSKYLDDLIVNNIIPSHVLPEMINGLVLLEHISQHLEHGLGLRQIVDWMMFVNNSLPDDKWPEFKMMAKNIGLKRLAVITTRMCELYLGLPDRNWCKNADETICKQLMEYILCCGNFGNKWNSKEEISKTVFTYILRPITAFKWFQERGLDNWRAAQKHILLRPFAWLYQIGRYIVKGIDQENSWTAIQKEYTAAKERIALFNTLGVKQKSKGLVVFKNGQYKKK